MKKSYDKKALFFSPYIFILMFFAGIVSGSALAILNSTPDDFSPLKKSGTSVFISSFESFLKPCLTIWSGGFFKVSPYLTSFVIAYRGAVFGFAVCTAFKVFGFTQGLIKSMTFSLPQNIIFFPFLLVLSTISAKAENKKNAGYFILLTISVIVCALSALIDTFVTSKLIHFTFR